MGAVGEGTPSKTPMPTPARNMNNIESSPDFRFRFKSPFSMLKGSKQDEAGLSPSSRNLLKDAAVGGTPGGGNRALFGTYNSAAHEERIAKFQTKDLCSTL